MQDDDDNAKPTSPAVVTRRTFLFQLAAAGAGSAMLANHALAATQALVPLSIDNPLTKYPNRGWEKVYRDLYRSDSSFTFLCAPNDTHNCLLRAHVKNGVVTRIAPTFGYSKATDLSGNKASQRWDPRCCQKGLALARRFYGDRRVKKPMVRKGFLEWSQAGYPRDPVSGAVDARYTRRGQDSWVAVTWAEAFDLAGKALVNIASTYNGAEGQKKLLAQGYDPVVVDATGGAGTQVLKFRGGMPALGMTRVWGQYRLANSMALLDDKLRSTGAEKAVGARGWDNYSWHTDLPPGHPMVTGQQTVDFDLCMVERCNLLLVWGMNWITTKMPDSHWLTEARMKGTKVVVISAEYSSTACKADELLIVRPGTTPALALGFAQAIIEQKGYDATYLKTNTDLPLLVRVDTGELLRASDVFADYKLSGLNNYLTVLKPGEKPPAPFAQAGLFATQEQRDGWGDYVYWDEKAHAPAAMNRDQFGKLAAPLAARAALEGTFEVTLKDGHSVSCRTVFDVTKELLDASYKPEQVEKLTWAPAAAIRGLAQQIAANHEKTMFAVGMGPNQFFNSDLKDRAILLVAALSKNIGRVGGNVGSYAGNYRSAYLNGLPQYTAEDPFDIELDPHKPVRVRQRWKGESVHYWNHGDNVLRMGKTLLTGKTHLPTPTKAIHVCNSNSLIGNVKGHYELVVNSLPKVDFIAVNEWWWTTSCEYADVVFPVDSWAELKSPDLTISVTNPFLYVFPTTPLPRIHDTRGDLEVAAGVGQAVGRASGDTRHADYWRFVQEDHARPYLQRMLDMSNMTRGYTIEDLEAKAQAGIPALLLSRTYPKFVGYEQEQESKPWYTRTGRLEFYRDEPEFRDSGENMIVHREPIDSTFYEPNVIVAAPHPLLRPKSPEDYGVSRADLSGDARQARHVIKSVEELMGTSHPLRAQGHDFIFHTPKYRHGAHTTPVDTDIVAAWFGPFGNLFRSDKRVPFITEAYVDMHPLDAKRLNIEDGDYVYIDADPQDRPFHGWQNNPEAYKVARLLVRARYFAGTPRGVTRMWHNMYGATYGSQRGARENPTGLAKSPETGYQALFRGGSHQSCTRGYLKPTWMTDTLYVKVMHGQVMGRGFVADIHCPTGAPREAMVKITRAEPGSEPFEGPLWRPAALGLRPTYENAAMKKFLAGGYTEKA